MRKFGTPELRTVAQISKFARPFTAKGVLDNQPFLVSLFSYTPLTPQWPRTPQSARLKDRYDPLGPPISEKGTSEDRLQIIPKFGSDF